VGQEKIKAVNEEVVKALGAFGGGIAASGGVCGILIGGVALASSIYSRGNIEGREDPRMWSMSHRFAKEFEKLCKPFGGTQCRDIAGVDWHDREAAKRYYSDPGGSRKICIKLVGDAAYALGVILDEERQEPGNK